MAKKILITAALLLAGFFMGVTAMHALREASAPKYSGPRADAQVLKTARAFSEIASVVSPSVVNISATKLLGAGRGYSEDPLFDIFDDFFAPYYDYGPPRKRREQSMGSGVIVSPDGYIITNNHVVSGADDIKVTLLDRRVYKAAVVGSDPKTDIAVLKIPPGGLPAVPWGDSDRLEVGEFVLAIGNPFSLSHTVTMGIISAVGRANVGIADYEDFIQTDAAINPGNSGGPLVDTSGEVIGINTAILSKDGSQGIGFAVPSNMAHAIMEQLIKEGKVVRGWMGVTIQELTPELASKFGSGSSGGALVGDVVKGSPAERSGIRRGDIITGFNKKDIGDPSALKNHIAQTRPGKTVEMAFLRKGRELRIKAVVGEHPKELAAQAPKGKAEGLAEEAFSGLRVIELTKDIARQLGVRTDEKGVVVVEVAQGSLAEDSGIRRGDVIEEIDGRKVSCLEEFDGLASGRGKDGVALLFVNRGGKRFYLTLKTS